MKTSPVPMICGVALAALSAAGFSHWWSVNQFVSAVRGGLPLPVPAAAPAVSPSAPSMASPAPVQLAATRATSTLAANADPSQKVFYETLVKRMESLQNQNRDLLDQMAETNRDVMKLEFRVDTHSESFRPMPLTEEVGHITTTSFDDGPGVLPPRAEPVFLPGDE